MQGSGAADTLIGGTGSDSLSGGLGADILAGGGGHDSFNAGSLAELDGDIITDFDEGDRISVGFGGSDTVIAFDAATGLLQIDEQDDGVWDAALTLQGVTGTLLWVEGGGDGTAVATGGAGATARLLLRS